jgi:hypothetical protein
VAKDSQRSAALKHGWRSGLEDAAGEQLDKAKVPYAYEGVTIEYEQPVKKRRYTPDFPLLHNGIVVETKGRFVTADRQKHLMVQKQYPKLDIRFVFSNPNTRISKTSETTYAMWCATKGFKCAKAGNTKKGEPLIPVAWLNEPPNHESLAIITKLLKEKKN